MNQATLRTTVNSDCRTVEEKPESEVYGPSTPFSTTGTALTASLAATVRSILTARRARDVLICRDLFAEPAWDILLELYAAELEQRRVTSSDLSASSAVPPTTSLRWIDRLETTGLVTRREDHLDRRRAWIGLSPAGSHKMQSYFVATGILTQDRAAL
ncbi:MAG TPA: MarR family transcriptional regulator [Sphingomicrobium sp.]|nr:MarR family transcriptional regulator [Sphingomicrobium sp.]